MLGLELRLGSGLGIRIRVRVRVRVWVRVGVRVRVWVGVWVSLPLFPNNCPSVRLPQVETLPSTPPTHMSKAQG